MQKQLLEDKKMNKFEQNSNRLKWCMWINGCKRTSRYLWIAPLTLALTIAGCGGQGSVLGSAGNSVAPPGITLAAPTDNDTAVAVHNTQISTTFSEPVALDGGASFIVSCATPCTNPAGTVVMDSTNRIATFTPTANLTANTLYTATITGARSLSSNVSLEAPYVWHFTTGAAPPPITVTAVAPAANTAGVSINNSLVTADFNEAIAPITGTASFTLTCALPCVNPTGTISRDPANKIAIYTLASGTLLTPLTLYTATIDGATSLATGAALASPFVWQFTTGNTTDLTRPSVTLTVPATTTPGPTMNVPTNMAISATFSENMAPASISTTSFTVSCSSPCVNPVGNVSYALGTKTAVFTPSAALAANTTYTATITTAVADLAGNTLASNYLWTFTTTTAVVAANVSVMSTNPADSSLSVCPGDAINATFSVPSGLKMDPASIDSSRFTLTTAAPSLTPVIAASVVVDPATGHIASFQPIDDLVAGETYTATLKSGNNGVKDFAIPANLMSNDFVWSFTVDDCTAMPPIVISLGSAAPFGAFGGSAGTTNQGIYTVINGDMGTTAVSTAVTGFHDGGPGCIYTETTLNIGTVNGNIFTAAPSPTVACPTEGTAVTAAIAAEARGDALIAYDALVAQPGGSDPGAGNLANLVLAPGVYTSTSGSFMIEGGDLTLDAQGNANAVWVFQMASTLTVGGPGAAAPQSIILVNGAQAKNVFWQVGTAATINSGGGGTMVGTIISQAGADVSTSGKVAVSTLNGRILSLNASVTLVNTVINVPAP